MTATALQRYADAGSWLAHVTAELEREEARNSLALGMASTPHEGGPHPYLSAIRVADRLSLAAIVIGLGTLVLAAPGEPEEAAIALLSEDLQAAGVRIETVIGAGGSAERFARRWTAETGADWVVGMRQRLHALTVTRTVPLPAGAMRQVRADEVPLCADWIREFEAAALGGGDRERALRDAERRVAAGELWLWDDAGPRAMAGRARRTHRTETINHVYTPPAERGRGYATALVAALSRTMISDGVHECVLFTDLANPTSNAIYARIGFLPVADFTLIRVQVGRTNCSISRSAGRSP